MHRSWWPAAALAGLGILTLACSEGNVVGPDQPAFASTATPSGFAKCSPQLQATASKTIYPGRWDTLKVGPHRLIFQPNSLSQATLITASAAGDSSRSVQFGPAGLKFNSSYPPKLQLSVQNCQSLTSTMYVAYSDDALTTVKEMRSSVVDQVGKTVSATIAHFSRYAVHF